MTNSFNYNQLTSNKEKNGMSNINKEFLMASLFSVQNSNNFTELPMLNLFSVLETTNMSKITKTTFSEIFECIKTDQDIKEKIADFKAGKIKKASLPSFFPTIFIQENVLSENSVPTGLVQFDVDLKDQELSIETIKENIFQIPELAYCFVSPSGGLKFSINTDFKKNPNDDLENLKSRYIECYKFVKAYVAQYTDAVFDDAVGHLKFACFLSYDPDVYVNNRCKMFSVNDRCFSFVKPKHQYSISATVDDEKIIEALKCIPRDLDYDSRLPLNMAVFNGIGQETGIRILMDHWTTPNRLKLLQDLNHQYTKRGKFPGIAYLFKEARKYGYPNATTSRLKRQEQPNDLIDYGYRNNIHIDEFLSPREADEKLLKVIDDFVQNKVSKAVNSSLGTGKTQKVLNAIKPFPITTKFLYVVKNHSLAEEVKERFDAIKVPRMTSHSTMIHIKGKEKLCELPDVVKLYKENQIPIPTEKCLNNCPFFAKCNYTLQFDSTQNIRIMTMQELTENSSFFFNGSESIYKNLKWIPDFIIVDENFIDTKTLTMTDSLGKKISNLVTRGQSLKDVVKELEQEICKEVVKKSQRYVDDASYIKNFNGQSNEVLKSLKMFCYTDDQEHLNGIKATSSGLEKIQLVKIQDKYFGIPTLFLDATGSDIILKRMMPDIEVVNINYRKSEDVKIFQGANFNFTKTWISKHTSTLIAGLKKIVGNYKNVGLITYKNLPNQKNFDEFLAKELDVKIFDHFGNVRGSNKFQDVDCLLIVGRHSVRKETLQDFTTALDGKCPDTASTQIDILARKTDDKFSSVVNWQYENYLLQEVANFLNRSETIQSLGRGRFVYGSKKDIFIFSNESLGTRIEIDDFFRYEDYFEYDEALKDVPNLALKGISQSAELIEKRMNAKIEKTFQKRLELVKDLQSVKDSPAHLMDLGFSKNFAMYKEERKMFFDQAGFELKDREWIKK